MKNKNSFTLRLSEDQLKIIKEIAKQEKRTVSAVVRNLIDDAKKYSTQLDKHLLNKEKQYEN